MTELARVPTFTEEQTAALMARAISPETAWTSGVTSALTVADLPEGAPDYWTEEAGYLPGLVFRWHSPISGVTVLQLRPDTPVPVKNDAGEVVDLKKYVFPKDAPSILHAAHVVEGATVALISEGTCQTVAVSAFIPEGVNVYGIAGCQSWMKAGVPSGDLAVVDGLDVLIALDADAATNIDVYDAGLALREACIAEGANSVRFIRVPGSAKSGLDDVLAVRAPETRTKYLTNLIQIAQNRPKAEKPEQPSAVKPKPKTKSSTNPFFEAGQLQVATLTRAVVGMRPAALTRESKVALYIDGVYRIDGTGFKAMVTELLGEDYRTSHETNAESFAIGQLSMHGLTLPDRMTEPLLNTPRVMVDLRTGEAIEHDPSYLSTVQIPVEFDPSATCPTYESWVSEQIGDQIDDLEESVCLMLDPTITPTKAVFLFGPSRSGKSTYLRLLGEIAGGANVTGVSLHELVEDKFAKARLYGKMLNVSADLSAAHVEDLSVFKMMTGEDLIHANRKYGGQFDFVNRALFAFSANELPTVGESSRAYSERIKPFYFGTSFAGREDATLETRLRGELPGILNRLLAAYRRRMERGTPMQTAPAVREMFELASDRVRQFVVEACEVLDVNQVRGGSERAAATASTTTELYGKFQEWAKEEGRATMAKSKFRLRLSTVPGVVESVSSGKSRGWNVRVRPRSEWGSESSQPCAPDSGPAVPAETPAPAETQQGTDLAPSSGKAETLTDVGGLYVLDHPTQHVDLSLTEAEAMKNATPHTRQDGSKRTNLHLHPALSAALSRAVAPAPAACPDCDSPVALRPPGRFWYACPRCHPATFTWTAAD